MLRGARVRICWDRDQAGRDHAIQVAESLRGAVESLHFRRAKVGKDVADHLEAGFALHELAKKKPVATPRGKKASGARIDQLRETFEAVFRALSAQAIEKGLPAPRKSADGRSFEACCPAHDDRNPSLSVTIGDTVPVLLKRHAGCSFGEILAACDLTDISQSATDALAHEARVARRIAQLKVERDARRQIREEDSPTRFELPKASRTLNDDLAEPARPQRFRIEQLHPSGGNSLLTAQYKTGKTTLLMNLMRSLADDEPFLDRFQVAAPDGRIAFLNYELDADMFRNWVRANGIRNKSRVASPLHLRGASLPLWEPEVRDEVVAWLRDSEVSFLILDPAAQAWRGMVESENDNTAVGNFLGAIDEIKRLAGVPDLVLATHMGRAESTPGNERSRGATRLQDWADVLWYMRATRGIRTFRAEGRDVRVDPVELHFEPKTRRVSATGPTQQERRDEQGVDGVLRTVAALLAENNERPTTTQVEQSMRGDKNLRSRHIARAEELGLITREKVGKPRLCALTDTGRARLSSVELTVHAPS